MCKKFDAVYRRSLEDPHGFWAEAAQDIAWYKERSAPATIDDPAVLDEITESLAKLGYPTTTKPQGDGPHE